MSSQILTEINSYDEYDSDDEYQHKCAINEEYQQYISNKAIEHICNLPLELQKMIFYFIPLTSVRTNEAKLIGNVISVYSIDHDPDLTKMAKMYYIKNIMPFWAYVFETLYREEYCGCNYGREEYDTLELSGRVMYELKK